MNQKIKQLSVVLNIEQKKTSDALIEYTKANKSVQDNELQLNSLRQYQQEYRKKVNGFFQGCLSAQTLQIYTRFISQLDKAILEQRGRLDECKKKAEEKFKLYLQAKQKFEGLQKVIEKEQIKEAIKQQKYEQKQYDESASNQWYSNRKEQE